MKKVCLVVIALLVLCLAAGMAGCSNNSAPSGETAAAQENANDEPANDEPATQAQAPAADAAAASSALIGSWEYVDGGFVYTFSEDGTGTYDVYGEIMKFTYADKGDTIEIRYEGIDDPTPFEYSIDGDTLIIKDSLGSDVKYIKK